MFFFFFFLSISCLLMAIVTGIVFQNLLKSSWKQQLRLKKNWLYQVNLGFSNRVEIKKKPQDFRNGDLGFIYLKLFHHHSSMMLRNAETCHFSEITLIHLCPWYLCSVGRSLLVWIFPITSYSQHLPCVISW